MQHLHLIHHPLLKDRLTRMRERRTGREAFASLMRQSGMVLAVESGRLLETVPVEVETPLELTTGDCLKHSLCLVPILRAGLGWMDAFQQVFPEATVGHLGMRRDEKTLKPSVYLEKVPGNLKQAVVMVLDPMLATGNSAVEAVTRLKKAGAKNTWLVCCVASPEGLRTVHAAHPDLRIIAAALDRELNSHGFILPGLGDAGDRQFGTE